MKSTTQLTNTMPEQPNDADFAIFIDFDRAVGKPQRVFKTMEALITAFEKLDRILCRTIDSNIEPVMLLEEIEGGSIKAWLKNKLNCVDDQAIKELDWRPLVGKYLVRAKYAVIKWCNESEGKETAESIKSLAKEIKTIAEETDVKYLPDYQSPNIAEIANSIVDISHAKENLEKNDVMKFVDKCKEEIEFNLSVSFSPEQLNEILVREEISSSESIIVLIIKKPDYLGNSQWDFRHGNTPVKAKIEHKEWLQKFQTREVDIRPGDAIKCKIIKTTGYGYDNEIIFEKYVITEVISVIPNQIEQLSIFNEDT